MADYQWFTRLHRKLYLLSGGRIGARLGKHPMALLYTIGRRSGAVRIVPLRYYDLDERGIIVLPSNNGQSKPPLWWLNLQAHPEITVQIGRQKQRVRAREIEPELRDRVWQAMCEQNERVLEYPQKSGRYLPIVLLERLRD